MKNLTVALLNAQKEILIARGKYGVMTVLFNLEGTELFAEIEQMDCYSEEFHTVIIEKLESTIKMIQQVEHDAFYQNMITEQNNRLQESINIINNFHIPTF